MRVVNHKARASTARAMTFSGILVDEKDENCEKKVKGGDILRRDSAP